MGVKNLFAISENKNSLGSKFRQKRFRYFLKLLSSVESDPIRILDVGGKESFWVLNQFHQRKDVQITLLNLEASDLKYDNFSSVRGDATDLSEYAENSFDLVFSNSVIEHLHSFENQIKMAKECQRVGIKHFIQTPNRYFFMEPHYLLPFFQFLPKKLQYFILTKTKVSRLKKWNASFARQYIDEIRLMSKSEMSKLFPGSILYREKFLWMSKSFTAHNLESPQSKGEPGS
ncbi:class I SAM-dependent methyltransferase [Roseivirga misakiensis]|uniref:Methyltransferase n=1 Tax=Roseivirga misakiensis TaxID=1563681 RepID=A0A1E5T5T8_9BACT|nr:methyltransferase domain-containing protein [Roseivirga misakiensis]OEK06754.1 methyltransferase [Roseivirga misakiensis]